MCDAGSAKPGGQKLPNCAQAGKVANTPQLQLHLLAWLLLGHTARLSNFAAQHLAWLSNRMAQLAWGSVSSMPSCMSVDDTAAGGDSCCRLLPANPPVPCPSQCRHTTLSPAATGAPPVAGPGSAPEHETGSRCLSLRCPSCSTHRTRYMLRIRVLKMVLTDVELIHSYFPRRVWCLTATHSLRHLLCANFSLATRPPHPACAQTQLHCGRFECLSCRSDSRQSPSCASQDLPPMQNASGGRGSVSARRTFETTSNLHQVSN